MKCPRPFFLRTILLFWGSCFVAALHATTTPAITVDSGWLLKSSQDLSDGGEAISAPGYSTQGWMKAQVPGTVLNSYVRNGQYPEPYYGLNNQLHPDKDGHLTQGLIPDVSVPGSVFSFPHWFRTAFTLPASDSGREIWLNLSAVNWKADVFVNGQSVGTVTGAFQRGYFDITKQAAIGPNTLAVKIYPLLNPGLPSEAGCGGNRAIGNTPATIYQNVNWDCSIIDGVRDRSIGIYRPVTVTTTGPVAIRDPFVYTDGVPTDDQARLGFRVYLINSTSSPQSGTLKLESDGISVSTPVSLDAGESREVALTGDDQPGLIVAHPKLWWPNGRGDPHLYQAKVSFTLDSGDLSDAVDTHFGIRSIEHDLFHQQNVFKVNGHRMFLAGGAWLQDAMLRSTPERYEAQARLIARAGFNWLRVWSGTGVESDDFFDACDKYGILVWVESGLTGQTDSPWRSDATYKKILLDNWQDSVLRVRGHPSVLSYCGCNESGDCDGMSEIVKKYDGTRFYQGNSQDNGQRGSPYRYQGVDCLYDYSGVDLFGAGPLGVFGGFDDESGNPCLPPIETLRQFIPAEKLWPPDQAFFNYHDGGGFHQVYKMVQEGCAAYGNFSLPDPAGRVGAANYAFKGQLVGAMQYRADGELWQRNKWDATTKFSTGWALWTVNNTFPEVCSRIYSYSLEPNASLFYVAHAQKPLHAQYDYFANDISAVNNSFADAPNLHVVAELHNLDWSLKWTSSKAVGDLPEETTRNGLISVPPKETPGLDDVHFIDVRLLDDQNRLVDDMIYWRARRDPQYGADGPFTALQTMPSTTLAVTASAAMQGDRQVVTAQLKNTGTNLAFFTRLKIYGQNSQQLVDGSFYSDNYISLTPGQERTITIDYPAASLQGDKPQLIVEGWNVGTLVLPLPGQGQTPPAKPVSVSSLDNIALYKNVTASSGAETAALAVDGDSSSGWTPGSEKSPSLTVDLGTIQPVNQVKLDWASHGFDTFDLQSSADGNSWQDVVAHQQGSGLSDTVSFPEHFVRYLKLIGDSGDQPPTLNEFEATGPAPETALPDLALHKPAAASSTAEGDPKNAFDGSLSTRWASVIGSDNEWLSVDLGADTTIAEMQLSWETAFARAYQIQVSPDGNQWSDVYSTQDGHGGVEDIKFDPVETRYVRILCSKRGSPYGYSLWECKVFAPRKTE
jgi:hypothetical protein